MRFIRSLVEFSGTLDALPSDRWLTIKLSVMIGFIIFLFPFSCYLNAISVNSIMKILPLLIMSPNTLYVPSLRCVYQLDDI